MSERPPEWWGRDPLPLHCICSFCWSSSSSHCSCCHCSVSSGSYCCRELKKQQLRPLLQQQLAAAKQQLLLEWTMNRGLRGSDAGPHPIFLN